MHIDPAQELLDVVVLAPTLGERATCEQSIAPRDELRRDMPTGKLTDRRP